MHKPFLIAAGLFASLVALPAFAEEDEKKAPSAQPKEDAEETSEENDKPREVRKKPGKPADPSKVGPEIPVVEQPPQLTGDPPPAPPKESGLALGTLIQQLDAQPVGNAVAAPVFGEDRAPPGDPNNPKALRLAMHGYFRAPLRIGWR